MKLSLAVGLIALLFSVADASSQYRNPSSGTRSSRSRRRRSAIHRDDYSDADYHRSLSSAPWEGGGGYSSSLNDDWDIEESSESFYDFEDIKVSRKKTKKHKRDSIDETERVLQALERSSKEEESENSKRRKRKKRQKQRYNDSVLSSSSSSSSSVSPKTPKRRKKRKRKSSNKVQTEVPKAFPTISRSDEPKKPQPFAKRAFVPKTASPLPSSTTKATTGTAVGSSPGATKQTPQPHPDRTKWEVPSYSHKISTMMKKTESKPSATATSLPRATRGTAPSQSNIGNASSSTRASVATTTAATPARRTKPTAPTTPQSSTLGSSTTPWVRKFLAARPKDRLLPLPRDYISDNFNLAQLPPIVERIGYQAMGDDAIPVAKALQQHRMETSQQPATRSSSYPIYKRALRTILEDPKEDAETTDEDLIIPPFAVQKAAEALYLMLHARFVISPRGLEAIRHVMALDNTVFGKCPRSCCKGTGLLPYGYSNDYTSDASVATVTTESRKEHDSCCHRYCPSCGEVWISWESKTDGCAWGPSWCHLFLLAYGSQVYAKELEAAAAASQTPEPQRTPTHVVRSFLPRGMRGTSATNNTNNATTENLSRPTPSVFGFRIHPFTDFGRPFNEASLRGGSND